MGQIEIFEEILDKKKDKNNKEQDIRKVKYFLKHPVREDILEYFVGE